VSSAVIAPRPEQSRGAAGAVFVHGLRNSRAMWEPQLAALRAAGVPCRAVDLPGHGVRRGQEFTMDSAISVVDQAVRSLPGPVLLVGLSLGGYIGIEYAARLARHEAPGAGPPPTRPSSPNRANGIEHTGPGHRPGRTPLPKALAGSGGPAPHREQSHTSPAPGLTGIGGPPPAQPPRSRPAGRLAGLLVGSCCAVPNGPLGRLTRWEFRTAVRLARWAPFGRRWLYAAAPPGEDEEHEAPVNAIGLQCMSDSLAAVIGSDPLTSLARLSVPIWFVNGRFDNFRLHERRFERAAGAACHGLTVIPGATHMANLDRPAAYTRAVHRALDALRRPGETV
jgi:pimeloyl-ACP methyl ester carboxylesterase